MLCNTHCVGQKTNVACVNVDVDESVFCYMYKRLDSPRLDSAIYCRHQQ